MRQITIAEKTDEISYEQIHQVLRRAHQVNKGSGFSMATADLSGEQIRQRIGSDGKCWVALDGDKVVGTLSIRMLKRNTWYAKGKVPDYMLAGVLPDYQGMHINSMLAETAFKYCREMGYPLMELDTAEQNQHAVEVYRHQGFHLVGYKATKNADHYSVVMAKWLREQPYSETYCRIRYELKKLYIRIRYQVGGAKRFRI